MLKCFPPVKFFFTRDRYFFSYELDLDGVKRNHGAKYLGQRSSRSKVILQTRAQSIDCITRPLKRVIQPILKLK